MLTRPGTRRVIVSGSGASYYVALAMWLASLQTAGPLAEIVPVRPVCWPVTRSTGARATPSAVSSSGEARDLIEATESDRLPQPFAAITANPGGSVSRPAGATAVTAVLQQVAINTRRRSAGLWRLRL